ncbi:MAG: signal peptidase I [Gemmatimonadales bacterium]
MTAPSRGAAPGSRPNPPPVPTQPRPRKSAKDEAISWAKAIGVALLIWIVLRSYLVEAFRIPSSSMENTLLVGDFLFVNKAVYGGELEIPLTGIHFGRLPSLGTPRRDQVVVFRSVEDSTPNLNIVKRVIGGPGDTLAMRRDTVIRNGRVLAEPYALRSGLTPVPEDEFRLRQFRAWQLPHYIGPNPETYRPTTHDWGPIVVPPGHYFVMGDNRDQSYDSRFWGFLPRAHIRGRPLFIYMSVAMHPFRIRWDRLFRTPS